jgi:hypothetical protein
MAAVHLAGLFFFVVAGACFLLVTFGLDHAGGVGLTPLGLLCFVVAVALHHHYGHRVVA